MIEMTTTEKLLPCPFCGGEAELMIEGTQPDVSCIECGISYSVQISDHFTHDERYNNPDFKWIDAPEYNYGVGGIKRAKEVLTEYWNTRADLTPVSAEDLQKVREIVERCKEYTYQIGGETNNQKCEREVKRMCREQAEICNSAISILDRIAKAVG